MPPLLLFSKEPTIYCIGLLFLAFTPCHSWKPSRQCAFSARPSSRQPCRSFHIASAASNSDSGTSSPSPIPPPPPISMPVWSLATPMKKTVADPADGTAMNIVTFATPVSVAAPKLWAVSLYYGTCTKDSFDEHGRGVLQLLKPKHKNLVPVLGKRSSNEVGYSKKSECSALGFDLVPAVIGSKDSIETAIELIPDCAAYIELELVSSLPAGDHELVLCRVLGTSDWHGDDKGIVVPSDAPQAPIDPEGALYTALLRQEGII